MMWLAQRALALQVERHVEDGFDFLLAEIQVADQISTVKICLHFVFFVDKEYYG